MASKAVAAVLALLPCLTAAAKDAPGVCLRSLDIEDTTKPDDSTILFTMRDRSVWKNTLTSRCFGLVNDPRGFTYEPTDPATDEICSNLVTIRLNTYGTVCLLGTFVRVK